jgi:hypothetical protein
MQQIRNGKQNKKTSPSEHLLICNPKMVRVGRVEPPSPAWKASILAAIRHPQLAKL